MSKFKILIAIVFAMFLAGCASTTEHTSIRASSNQHRQAMVDRNQKDRLDREIQQSGNRTLESSLEPRTNSSP